MLVPAVGRRKVSRYMIPKFEVETTRREKKRGRRGGGNGIFYLLLELAELIVLPLSILVNLLLSFAASVFDALGSVYRISPRVNFGNWFWLKEPTKPPEGGE